MGQIADERQRDRGHAGAQPVLRRPAQVRRYKPQPRCQPHNTGGQQQLEILIVRGIKGLHPVGDVRPGPVCHRRVHHAGADPEQLAPERLIQPACRRDPPGRAAVGAPIIVDDQHLIQPAEAWKAGPEVCQQKQHRRRGHDCRRHAAPQPVQRHLPPAQCEPKHRP